MPSTPPFDGPTEDSPNEPRLNPASHSGESKSKRWREEDNPGDAAEQEKATDGPKAKQIPLPKNAGGKRPPKAKSKSVPPPITKSPKVDIQSDSERHESPKPWVAMRDAVREHFSSWSTSLMVHSLIILLLTLLIIRTTEPVRLELRGTDSDDVGQDQELLVLADATPQLTTPDEGWQSNIPDVVAGAVSPRVSTDQAPSDSPDTRATTLLPGLPADRPSGMPVGGGLAGRTPQRRRELGKQRGATEASEEAVELGLAWLAAHQRRNGAWWFDHHDGPCDGRCPNPGDSGCSTAATGLALLAFLGAGYTAEEGPYQEEVRNGIYYLLSKTRITRYGGDLREGSMYGQGIATLALCEAYAMTGDQAIRPIAQKAIDYICSAQHKAGGWRYNPGQPGDTTVFGWQFMALKSASMSGLDVPTPTVHLAQYYLDSVQTAEGAFYGYLSPGKQPSPTAIGLLSRMYSGWRRQNPALKEGVDYLYELAPSKTDMYFNYYATQVMSHYNSQQWDPWNRTMRDFLIETQEKRGHARGSWYFPDQHGDEGGRLYNTAMAIMILEVYYRYLPLYELEASELTF